VNDWWSTLDSEQSQGEVVHMDTSRSVYTAPEFTHSLYDPDGLYVTVHKGQYDNMLFFDYTNTITGSVILDNR